MAPVVAPPPKPIRKKLVRRAGPDRSQALRRGFQLAFFALNAWIGIEFYLFVRYYETGGRSVWAGRPPGVEGWLPIASMMNLKVLLASGQMPRLHPAGMFLLLAFLAASWIFRKSFCGWLCPVGTVSEYLWKLGRQTFGRNFRLPRKLDVGAAQPEVPPARTVRIRRLLHERPGHPRVPGRPLRHRGRREDAQLLPLPGPDRRHRGGAAGGRFGVRAEFLVPLPVSVRRVDGAGRPGEPAAHPARGIPVHRLRQVREGMPFRATRGRADHHPVGGVYRLPGVRSGMPGRGSADDVGAAHDTAFPPGRWPLVWPSCSWASAACAQWAGYWRTDLPSDVYFRLVPHANEFTHPR